LAQALMTEKAKIKAENAALEREIERLTLQVRAALPMHSHPGMYHIMHAYHVLHHTACSCHAVCPDHDKHYTMQSHHHAS
jgi:hypothetical protein